MLLVAAAGLVFWPGVPVYDTVDQYGQVLSGEVEDWHPPIMVRLWQALHSLALGTQPMFVLQLALYGVGFALIVAALARQERPYASAAAALVAVSPLVLAWQMVVLKDGQMLGALLAALGIIVHYRLRGASVPLPAAAAATLLIAYATMVRANALFATVPLCALLVRRPRSLARRAGVAIFGILLLLALEPFINHRLFAASPSGIVKSQPVFDLAAIAVAEPYPVAPFTPAERAQLIARHCVKSFFWDPLGEPSACGSVTERAKRLPARELYRDLALAAIAHPLAYAVHRLKHWNSSERWLVPPGLIGAAPPADPEPNDEGLVGPENPAADAWVNAAAWEAGTPLGWPITWTALAALLLPVAWRRRDGAASALALALLVSALALEASFLVISIASDLRYHLWSMVATPLALVFLGEDPGITRREWGRTAALLAMVVAGGLFTRAILPAAPDTYQAMLHAPTS